MIHQNLCVWYHRSFSMYVCIYNLDLCQARLELPTQQENVALRKRVLFELSSYKSGNVCLYMWCMLDMYVAVPGRNRTLLCCTCDACWICMWQSQVEIEHYSVAYFDHIIPCSKHCSTVFPLWAGLIHAVWLLDMFTQCVLALPLYIYRRIGLSGAHRYLAHTAY